MDGKPYKCNECEASFALLGEFRVHISENHADTKDLRCSECYRVFPSPGELSQHVRLEHRLECEVCMKTFSRLAYLQVCACVCACTMVCSCVRILCVCVCVCMCMCVVLEQCVCWAFVDYGM